jgi:hypothetical protein
MADGWRKRQIADQALQDDQLSLGELLRIKIENAINKEDSKKSYLPQNMTNQQLLDMTPHDVYTLIATGSWAIEHFAEWVYACETHAYKTGVEEGGLQ